MCRSPPPISHNYETELLCDTYRVGIKLPRSREAGGAEGASTLHLSTLIPTPCLYTKVRTSL